ncbi:putative toxin-antitoxin system toxin component, PIN family [Schaedlerella arabinosiphila]|jgi:putative PIN family toxin of toxin-antitoxin system|uniref:Putative toxin-antitoxin system toxin component, PIN family n=1 Tax=Schaedlerella arabinosiphila TaxID=2044587 RepID=A0A426DIU4_9FIRM|nr:putative toxin-antitoxin system toxin component, PIN family [Schaedlerella arabinosiphila]RRK32820.1 putative toxin-antitoxin system toxin component, PIN family [Schaedlerella arabinosiphila]
MRIVIDTNVLISGVFFGGFPRKILSAVVGQKIFACATAEIIIEYEEIVQEMISRKQGHINRSILSPLIKAMKIIEPVTHVKVCRDPDDNKFLECANDSHALYVVSGDKDLLIIGQYENVQIVTAKEFCEKFLLC